MNYLRIALNNSQFPFKYEERQVPALVPGMDTANRAPAAFTGSAGNMDWNIPQVIHVENYLPTARGYVGVVWNQVSASQDKPEDYVTFENTQLNFSSGTLGSWSASGLELKTDPFYAWQGYGAYGEAYLVGLPGRDIVPSNDEYQYYTAGTVISYAFVYTSSGAVTPWIAYGATASTAPAGLVNLPGTYDGKCFSGTYTVPTTGYYMHFFQLAANSIFRLTAMHVVKGEAFNTKPVDIVNGHTYPMLYKGTTVYRQVLGSWLGYYSLGVVNCEISTAQVNGVRYNHYFSRTSGFNALYKDDALQSIVRPAGYPTMVFSSIVGSSGYLVGVQYQSNLIHWSTPTNALDFSGYGSGYSTPSGLMGSIHCLVPILNGFVIFTATNAVLATYTNIPNAPFRFQVIANAGGVSHIDAVSGDPQAQIIYAHTSRGFQMIGSNGQCQTVPEVGNFLTSGELTQLDGLQQLERVRVLPVNTGAWNVRVSYVKSRYVTVSIRSDNSPWYQHALVLDLTLNRWGHVRLSHITAVEAELSVRSYDATSGGDNPLMFLTPTGSVVQAFTPGMQGLNPHIYTMDVRSGAVLGPLSLVRGRKFTLQEVELSNVTYAEGLSLRVNYQDFGLANLPAAYQGSLFNYSTVSGTNRKYFGRVTADNAEICVSGTINLQNLVLGVTKHGN